MRNQLSHLAHVNQRTFFTHELTRYVIEHLNCCWTWTAHLIMRYEVVENSDIPCLYIFPINLTKKQQTMEAWSKPQSANHAAFQQIPRPRQRLIGHIWPKFVYI